MLTQRMQVHAIAERMRGIETDLCVDDFDDPWYSAYMTVAEATDQQDAYQALVRLKLAGELTSEQLGEITEAGSLPMEFPSLQEIADELPEVDWLWTNWIPRGMISLLGAVPGAGKSYVALDLARRIISGEPFPDGAPVPVPEANVIYVDAECVPQITNERAMAWEMDRSRLFIMLPEDDDLIDFGNVESRDRLVEMVHTLHPELVIIDSLSSISLRGENNVEDVRNVLAFLNIVAREFQVGLLLIHHLRKRGSKVPMLDILTIDDFRGSSHIIAMSRSVLGLSVVQTGPEMDRNGPRRLEVIKTNLARYPEPIGVEFQPLHPRGVWLQYGDAPQRYHEPTKLDECAAWLLQVLEESEEPLKPKDIIEMARAEGYSRAMVYRAREQLGEQIVNTQGRQSPDNAWTLCEG